MATNLSSFHTPAAIRASSSSAVKSDSNRLKAVSANWWSPIFGWSSEPDYVAGSANETVKNADPEPESGRLKSRFAPGCFTAKKAKILRMKTMENSAFHDIMYHSAIASRLASDLSDRGEN